MNVGVGSSPTICRVEAGGVLRSFFFHSDVVFTSEEQMEKEKKLLNEMITFARIHRDSIIADLEVYDECLDFNFYLQFCPNLEEGEYEYS